MPDDQSQTLSPEEIQQLRTKFRIERQYAVSELGVEPDASRAEIREAIINATPWEREQLHRRKQQALQRLNDLMAS